MKHLNETQLTEIQMARRTRRLISFFKDHLDLDILDGELLAMDFSELVKLNNQISDQLTTKINEQLPREYQFAFPVRVSQSFTHPEYFNISAQGRGFLSLWIPGDKAYCQRISDGMITVPTSRGDAQRIARALNIIIS